MAYPTTSGDSTLSQSIQVPPLSSHSGLSFLYLFSGSPTPHNNFTLQVTRGAETTTLFSNAQSTDGWAHQWFDLSAYAGRTVTLTFSVYNLAGYPATSAFLDEVSVGSTHPDAWVQATPSVHALPGSLVVVPISFGNRGRVLASGSQLTLSLPAGLTFVSASVAPTTTSPNLTWNVGDLPAQSGPTTLWVTLQVDAGVPLYTSLVCAFIMATPGELETANNTAHETIFTNQQLLLPFLTK